MTRLQLPFVTESPEIDERKKDMETVPDMVRRLSEEKANQVAQTNPDAFIIGSDQSVECMGRIMGKPTCREKAKEQLMLISGQSLLFHTGICILNSKTNALLSDVIDYRVIFRKLTEDNIEYYLDKEQAFDCVGSFKSEQLGIALVEKMEGNDPTALIGLPLIRLCEMLRQHGIKLP